MIIREVSDNDFDEVWPIFHEIISAGETNAYQPNTAKEQALNIWLKIPRKTFVCEENGNILGTDYLKTNQAGPGGHVCNCGYMVSSQGRSLATAMCEHSQKIAKELGYKAKQCSLTLSHQVMGGGCKAVVKTRL
ncbi:MAG: GNAT family N-acetyltransferase [Gammaproteobacteria bacterium]